MHPTECSPRERGRSGSGLVVGRFFEVLPARAGMTPRNHPTATRSGGAPLASGDNPFVVPFRNTADWYYQAVDPTLTRALERGDLRADLDRQLTLDLLGSLVHYRALFGHATTTDADIESAVETLLRGAATDYQRLLEHAQEEASASQAHHLHAADPTD